MNVTAKFSAKGQIVIPKDVRERYRFANGEVVEVVETPDGVLLRTPRRTKAATVDDAIARIRKAVRYEGPRLDEADWQKGIEMMLGSKAGSRKS